MNFGKILRVIGVSLALLGLLVFATVVVSDWHDHNAANDARCPYCHLGHQTAAQPETSHCVAVLLPLASLPLPEESHLSASPVFSHTAPRAPPAA